MTQSTVTLIVLSLFLGAGAWLIFLWAVRRGEFDDVEGPKHRMLYEDDVRPPGHGPDPPTGAADHGSGSGTGGERPGPG